MTSPITTHVLDTAQGKPAEGVGIKLCYEADAAQWLVLGEGVTNKDGRIANLIPDNHALAKGRYKMTFNTGNYQKGFYPYVDVVFEITESGQHYHIPLLLSPYGYSTYRGS